MQHLETSQTAARRLFEMIDAPPSVTDLSQPLPPPVDFSIEFRGVSFRYLPDEPLALDDVSFRIPNGKRFAIIGASGAGKSTLVNLLLRFWEPNSGGIFIGGNALSAYRGDDARANCWALPLSTLTCLMGLCEITCSWQKAMRPMTRSVPPVGQRRLEEFIASLPAGYDTLVGENGLKLSGGERQRIAIARVILKKAPILILDEATANLDAVTERKVLQGLETFMQGRTTLIISHRRAGFELADQILALERGRVVPSYLPFYHVSESLQRMAVAAAPAR